MLPWWVIIFILLNNLMINTKTHFFIHHANEKINVVALKNLFVVQKEQVWCMTILWHGKINFPFSSLEPLTVHKYSHLIWQALSDPIHMSSHRAMKNHKNSRILLHWHNIATFLQCASNVSNSDWFKFDAGPCSGFQRNRKSNEIVCNFYHIH